MHAGLNPDQMHVAVDILMLTVRGGQIGMLLSQRNDPPYRQCWALPGALVGLDESAETAVDRLMREMLPLSGCYTEQLYTFSELSRDPRGRVISVAYLAIIPWILLEKLLAGGETSFRYFRIGGRGEALRMTADDGLTLSASDLAFDHGRITAMGLKRLKGKIDYTEVGFHFLDDLESFTLSGLQTVFEAVLGERLDSSNFRRTMIGRYEKTGRMEPTGRTVREGRGRPAVCYRLKRTD